MEKKGTLTGFIPDLVAKIAQRLRTPYHLKQVAWGAYGVRQDSGGWNGMIGEIMRGVSIHGGGGVDGWMGRWRCAEMGACVRGRMDVGVDGWTLLLV